MSAGIVNRIQEPLGERFLKLWTQGGGPPDLELFLAENADASSAERLEAILMDQHRRAEAGCRRSPESYLAAHPDVGGDPDRKLAVVYEDYRLRRERGEAPEAAEYLARFPDLREALGRQFEVAEWMDATGGSATVGAQGTGTGDDDGFADPDAEASPLSTSDFDLGPPFPEGGMGIVRRAWQRSLHRRVALKFLKDIRSPESVRRFLQEARTVGRLHHPGIVPIFGLGRAREGEYFLVMGLVDGPSLAERMKVAAIRPERAAGYIADAAEAIQYAHEQGVIHRDLKPGNILIDRHGRTLVTDFGLAKRLDTHTPGQSHPDQIIGTLEYMAPEQVDRRWGPIAPASDIYGLGATLYALLTGRPPFVGSNKLDLLRQVGSDEPPPPVRKLCAGMPPKLEAICLKCLQKDPADRYTSALELAQELRAWLDRFKSSDVPLVARTGSDLREGCSPAPSSPTQSVSRRRVKAWLIATLILIPLAAGISLAWRGGPHASNPVKIEAFDVFRGRKEDPTMTLTATPGPLDNDDGVAVKCRLSRPAYPYLFWVHSHGDVETLYPEDQRRHLPVAEFRWPPDASKTEKIINGAPGTELAILVVRDEPLGAEALARLKLQLRPREPLRALHPATVLIDETPIERSRGSGELEDMYEGPVISFLAGIRGSLQPEIGMVRTVALPHVEKR
jgi:serine/threonine-protein kinase